MHTARLGTDDRHVALILFTLMAEVFAENREALSDAYLDGWLARQDFWALPAFDGDRVIGGINAHTLPMSRSSSRELFICDLAVEPNHQRRGVGRRLVRDLQTSAAAQGIHEMFVPADNEDEHDLNFYRAIGGVEMAVTHFSFTDPQGR